MASTRHIYERAIRAPYAPVRSKCSSLTAGNPVSKAPQHLGPVALCPRLSTGLPLIGANDYAQEITSRQEDSHTICIQERIETQ